MVSPEELLEALAKYEDSQSAVGVYRQAQQCIKAYEQVKAAALDCAKAECQLNGVLHTKFEHGSAGWTQPKAKRLDREAWAAARAKSKRLAQLQERADIAAQALLEAQEQAGCLVASEPRFYIR